MTLDAKPQPTAPKFSQTFAGRTWILSLAITAILFGCATRRSDLSLMADNLYPMKGNPRYRRWYPQPDGTSKWCPKQSRFGGRGGDHKGVDLESEGNAEIRAITAGNIEYNVVNDPNGWGNHIYLYFKRNGETYIAVYAHLDPGSQFTGTKAVKAGDWIGLAGCTGNAGGGVCDRTHKCVGTDGQPFIAIADHLHLELKKRISQNPEKWEQVDPVKFFGWTVEHENETRCTNCLP
jgi:murein DD-endopeptidase MepM/ murein hydrolase activator NlpD